MEAFKNNFKNKNSNNNNNCIQRIRGGFEQVIV